MPLSLQPEVPLRVFAASDPVIACAFSAEVGGRLRPYDLTGAAVEFYIKPRAEDPDGLPAYSTAASSIIVTDAPGGLASVQLDERAIRYAGQFRYHVDAVKNNRRTVLAWGPLTVVDR